MGGSEEVEQSQMTQTLVNNKISSMQRSKRILGGSSLSLVQKQRTR